MSYTNESSGKIRQIQWCLVMQGQQVLPIINNCSSFTRLQRVIGCTDSFIGALKRFIARRGKPSDIYNDNGTNFVGANNELRKILKDLFNKESKGKIEDFIASEGIVWYFNPPATPHFRGLWEAGIKSLKSHLKRVAGNTVLTHEEFSTLVTQVEAVLNSIPLCNLSSDTNDKEAFPYVESHIEDYIMKNWEEVKNTLALIQQQSVLDSKENSNDVVQLPSVPTSENIEEIQKCRSAVIAYVKHQMKNNRNDPAMKQIQGLALQSAFRNGDILAHCVFRSRPGLRPIGPIVPNRVSRLRSSAPKCHILSAQFSCITRVKQADVKEDRGVTAAVQAGFSDESLTADATELRDLELSNKLHSSTSSDTSSTI
ncbi:hypothetical protein AVEN_158928-1 [Araneus ventricosus]|uniref:Integrase catalytic domain-containing protein n=1 Tax=Araneus ventricosus TaxID=182803 RepID=A0A4Y2BAL0_ARAVE|nr:hypothetical protein AVEN_158928-1 [Araneus ventricosus]